MFCVYGVDLEMAAPACPVGPNKCWGPLGLVLPVPDLRIAILDWPDSPSVSNVSLASTTARPSRHAEYADRRENLTGMRPERRALSGSAPPASRAPEDRF